MFLRRVLRSLLGFGATMILGGFLAATMVRMSPGFGLDERELDPRLDGASLTSLRQAQAAENDIARFYVRYLGGMLRGDFGFSRSLNQPVSRLLGERIGVTARLMAFGLGGAWLLGLAAALPAALFRARIYRFFAGAVSGILLCLPAAVVALLVFVYGGPVYAAIAVILFPQIFHYARNILRHSLARPYVLAARARGVGTRRILFWHVLPASAPQLLALAGVSLSIAFGTSIPVEVICDLPGIGQLAWKAALARDLPVLVALTLLIALGTQLANALADLAIARTARRHA